MTMTPGERSGSATTRPSGFSPRAHRRGWTRFLVIVVTMLAAVVGLDRLADIAAAGKLASTIQSAQHLSTRPHVSIGGWPFITQVIAGHYSDVTISSTDPIGTNGITVNNANVHLRGVKVSLSDAIHGTVTDMPVHSGDGTALIAYPTLDAAIAQYAGTLGAQITVVGTTPGHARLQGPFGLSLDIAARVRNEKLSITPDSSQLAALPSLVRGPVRNALAQPIALPKIPFNVTLSAATLEPDGVHLRAIAHNSVFPVR